MPFSIVDRPTTELQSSKPYEYTIYYSPDNKFSTKNLTNTENAAAIVKIQVCFLANRALGLHCNAGDTQSRIM